MAKLGDKRIYKGFAIFPKTVENKRIWWKPYYSIYEYKQTSRLAVDAYIPGVIPRYILQKYNRWEHVKNILYVNDNRCKQK